MTVLGYGLDLSKCAVSGSLLRNYDISRRGLGEPLIEQAAGEWVSKLLHLPSIILKGSGNSDGIIDGLKFDGIFLTKKFSMNYQ